MSIARSRSARHPCLGASRRLLPASAAVTAPSPQPRSSGTLSGATSWLASLRGLNQSMQTSLRCKRWTWAASAAAALTQVRVLPPLLRLSAGCCACVTSSWLLVSTLPECVHSMGPAGLATPEALAPSLPLPMLSSLRCSLLPTWLQAWPLPRHWASTTSSCANSRSFTRRCGTPAHRWAQAWPMNAAGSRAALAALAAPLLLPHRGTPYASIVAGRGRARQRHSDQV